MKFKYFILGLLAIGITYFYYCYWLGIFLLLILIYLNDKTQTKELRKLEGVV